MAVFKHGKHEVELYDDIQKLPFLRFQKFNKYQMIANEIGNDFVDYDRRTEKALAFFQKGMVKEGIQELNNRRQAVYNAYNEKSPTGFAAAAMVKRIDDVYYTEYGPDDLENILVHINNIGFTIEEVLTALSAVKKKIETQLVVYFPHHFPKDGNKEETFLRYNRANLLLDKIIEPSPNIDQMVYGIEKEILEGDKPNSWNIHDENNMERIVEVDSRKYALTVAEMSNQDLKTITVFDFYATVDLLKEKHTKN